MTQTEKDSLIKFYNEAHLQNYSLERQIRLLLDTRNHYEILKFVVDGFKIAIITRLGDIKPVSYRYVQCNRNTCGTFACENSDDHILKIVSLDVDSYYNPQESTTLWPTWKMNADNLKKACMYLCDLIIKLNQFYESKVEVLKNIGNKTIVTESSVRRVNGLKAALRANNALFSTLRSEGQMPKQLDVAIVTDEGDVKGDGVSIYVRYEVHGKYCYSPTHSTLRIFTAIKEDKWTWCRSFYKTEKVNHGWPMIEIDLKDDGYNNLWLVFWRKTIHKLMTVQEQEYQELTGGLPPIDSLNNIQDGKSNNSGTTAKISNEIGEIISRQIGRGAIVSVRAIGITVKERYLNNETSSIEG